MKKPRYLRGFSDYLDIPPVGPVVVPAPDIEPVPVPVVPLFMPFGLVLVAPMLFPEVPCLAAPVAFEPDVPPVPMVAPVPPDIEPPEAPAEPPPEPPAEPPPEPPPACANASELDRARTEAKAIVVIFIEISLVCVQG